MEALRRIFAILLADLRERTRTPRFWIVLGLVGVATWYCFPAFDSGHLAISVDDARGRYSSAWTGMTLGLFYSTMLAWLGFYLVRGTVLRDFDTRVWQLLVATPMTRRGYLVAKWGSHMAVFSCVIAVGLAVGVLAQWVRGEDRAFDLVELVKPVLVLTLPALSLTAFFAILFDMVPILRRTGGNVLYFFVWLLLFARVFVELRPRRQRGDSAHHERPGRILAGEPFVRAGAGARGPETRFHQGQRHRRHRRHQGTTAPVRVDDLACGRRCAPWPPVLACAGSVRQCRVGALPRSLGRPHRCGTHHGSGRPPTALAGSRPPPARARRAGHAGRSRNAVGPAPSQPVVVGAMLIAGIVQLAAPLPNAAIAAVVAWMLGIDVHARALLRESETRTAGLVFTAPDAARRVSLARLGATVLLSLVRLTASSIGSVITVYHLAMSTTSSG